MKNVFNFKKSRVASTVEKEIKKMEPSQEQINKDMEDVVFLSDICMRMLANRSFVVCFNTVATVINTLAGTQPQKGRNYLAECLEDLANSIRNMPTDVEPKSE